MRGSSDSAGRAFWYLCHKCHERAWPEDKRGRAARPGVDQWLGAASGSNRRAAVRVSCGDLYLTTPPPEFLPPSSPRPRTSNASTARSRTPPSSAISKRATSSVSRPQSLRCSFTRPFRPDLRVQWSGGGVWRYQVGARYADEAVACGLERRARIEVLQQERHTAGDTECDGCGLTGRPGFLRFNSVLATNDTALGPCNAALCSSCRSRPMYLLPREIGLPRHHASHTLLLYPFLQESLDPRHREVGQTRHHAPHFTPFHKFFSEPLRPGSIGGGVSHSRRHAI